GPPWLDPNDGARRARLHVIGRRGRRVDVAIAARPVGSSSLGPDASRTLVETIAVQDLDVLRGEHIPEALVADAPRGVAGAALLRPEEAEMYVGGLHHLGESSGDLAVARVEGAHAADPEEHVHLGVISQRWDAEAVGPVGARVVADFPRILVAL